jgi:UDP-N-acetylmuramoyl-L-alanyl-D-glutamate--2,6-diaminopimelate ligase
MPTGLSLGAMLAGCEASYSGPSDEPITGVAYDSRQVVPGDVFVAIPGFVHDGVVFATQALAAGAVAVVAEVGPEALTTSPLPRTWVRVPDARLALALMASRFFDNPGDKLEVIGITGTNGKTTVTALLELLLSCLGPVGRWSTTVVSIGGRRSAAQRTTPEAVDLQRALSDMVDAGCRAAAIEVSSHALALKRVEGINFAAAVFTNLSPDHLDFHSDLDDYLDAKAILFETMGPTSVAVLNADEPSAGSLAERAGGRVVAYGWDPGRRDLAPVLTSRDIRQISVPVNGVPVPPSFVSAPPLTPSYVIREWQRTAQGSLLRLDTPVGTIESESPLFGPTNAENLAAGIATAIELGCPASQVAALVESFPGPRGRLQRIEAGQPFVVLVDYAHTPAALEAALAAARSLVTGGRVIVIFSCGGDRDQAKRPMMGAVAACKADYVLITTDNPRSEDPGAIIRDIEAGVPTTAAATVASEIDRVAAIERALDVATPGDCVLLAGKGHETEQVFADRVIEHDDRRIAEEWLKERYGEDQDTDPGEGGGRQ